jgi:hypothetical protein
MWDFSVGRSFAMLAATFPFILLRLVVFYGISIGYIFATGLGAGFGYTLGLAFTSDPAGPAFFGGLLGFGFVSVVLYWIREYILYVVKAGHIAVLVEAYDGRNLPAGQGQLGYARQIVTARFAETNILFAVDQLVKGVIGAITRIVWTVANFLPIPGLDGLMKFVNAVIRVSLSYIDEVILAYDIRERSENPWSTAQDALVLYAQNNRTIIKNAIWLAIIMYVVAFLVFLLMLAPAAAIVYVFPGGWSGFGFLFAIVFAWSFKAAIMEPFAIASLMQVYFRMTEGQVPDPVWRERLEGVSTKYRALGEKALAWVRGTPAAAPAFRTQ